MSVLVGKLSKSQKRRAKDKAKLFLRADNEPEEQEADNGPAAGSLLMLSPRMLPGEPSCLQCSDQTSLGGIQSEDFEHEYEESWNDWAGPNSPVANNLVSPHVAPKSVPALDLKSSSIKTIKKTYLLSFPT